MYDIRSKQTTNPQEIQFADMQEDFGCVLKNNLEDSVIEISNEDGDESISILKSDADNLINALIAARDEFDYWSNVSKR